MPLGYWLASSKLPDPLLHHQSGLNLRTLPNDQAGR